MHSIETIECLLCVLVSRRYRDNHYVRFQCSFLHMKSGEVGTTTRQSRRAWDVEQKYQTFANWPRVPQMRIARGTCVIAQCRLCAYKYTLTAVIISSSTLARTLAPPLALDDARDEALRCRNLSDAVFTPTVDIVLSAVAVGVLRLQVRARKIELLGLIFHSV